MYREELGWFTVFNLLGNVMAFVPFGAILPVFGKKRADFFEFFSDIWI